MKNPFSHVSDWWRRHDTTARREEASPAAREARHQAEINRYTRPPSQH